VKINDIIFCGQKVAIAKSDRDAFLSSNDYLEKYPDYSMALEFKDDEPSLEAIAHECYHLADYCLNPNAGEEVWAHAIGYLVWIVHARLYREEIDA
jgi:hypothetical protein